MTGFTLSRAPFRKKCGALQLGRKPYFSWKKTGDLFSHHRSPSVCQKVATFFAHHSLVSLGVAHFFGMEKFAAPIVGPFFVGPLFGRT